MASNPHDKFATVATDSHDEEIEWRQLAGTRVSTVAVVQGSELDGAARAAAVGVGVVEQPAAARVVKTMKSLASCAVPLLFSR